MMKPRYIRTLKNTGGRMPVLVCLLSVLLIAITFLGCEHIRGEDGFEGHDGSKGLPGPQGPEGEPGELGLPCDECVDHASIMSDAMTSVKVADAAVGDTQFAPLAINGSHIQEDAVGTAQLADASVTSDKLRSGVVRDATIIPGRVGPGKVGPDAVEAGDIGPDAVGSANLCPDSVEAGDIAPGAVEAGDIADNAVTGMNIGTTAVVAEHFQMGAINEVWTVTGTNDTSIGTEDRWEDMNQMELALDGYGHTYLILFNGSFYSSGTNNYTYIALVLMDGDTPIRTLNKQRIASAYRYSEYVSVYSYFYKYCYTGGWYTISCYSYHNHTGAQYLGNAPLMWAGAFNASDPYPYTVRVQWYEGSSNTISQMTGHGNRTLTAIEFKKAESHEKTGSSSWTTKR